jgi:hypothetical protein
VEIGVAIERRVDLGMRDASLPLLSPRMSIPWQGSLGATVRHEYKPNLQSTNAMAVVYPGQWILMILARDRELSDKEELRNIYH